MSRTLASRTMGTTSTLAAAALLLACPAASIADDKGDLGWTGPGWYAVEYVGEDIFLEALFRDDGGGPYRTKAECDAYLKELKSRDPSKARDVCADLESDPYK